MSVVHQKKEVAKNSDQGSTEDRKLFEKFKKYLAMNDTSEKDPEVRQRSFTEQPQETSTRLSATPSHPRKALPPLPEMPPFPPKLCKLAHSHKFANPTAFASVLAEMRWSQKRETFNELFNILEIFSMSCFQNKQMSGNRTREAV